MPRKVDKQERADRHRPARMVRLPEPLAVALERCAENNCTTLTQEVVRASKEYAERHNVWPPAAAAKIAAK